MSLSLEPDPFDGDAFLDEFPSGRPLEGDGEVRGAEGQAVIPPVHDERVGRMLRASLRAYRMTVLSGIPGTGKGVTVRHLVDEVRNDPQDFGFAADHAAGWPFLSSISPHDAMGYADLVGSLTPRTHGEFEWTPGVLLRALAEDRWFYIDELNRGDLDVILGPILPWLAGERMEVGRTSDDPEAMSVVIDWDGTHAPSYVRTEDEAGREVRTYYAGQDFRLLGTLNPRDAHRVFTVGRALGRRMKMVPIPPLDEERLEALLIQQHPDLDPSIYEGILGLYSEHLQQPESRLGAASFLEIPMYVEAALANERTEEPLEAEEMQQLLAEAYLLAAGRELKSLPGEQWDRLGSSEHVREALGDAGWKFVLGRLQELA